MENVKEKDPNVTSVSEFETKSITTLFWKYSLFAMAGMAVQIVTVITDGVFVGNGIGPIGMGAIGILVPFWVVSNALFNLFGIGGSVLAGIKLGNGDREGARQVYGNVIIFSFLFCALISVITFFNIDSILVFLGATPELLPSCKIYAVAFLIMLPFCLMGVVAYYFVRLAERPLAASIAFIVPAAISILSEYIFIFKLHMGMLGSAIPWGICLGGAAFLVPYMQKVDKTFYLKASDFKLNLKIMGGACKIGFAMFAVSIGTIFSTIMINNLISQYGEPALHLPVFGIINAYMAYILTVITVAFIQGIQPIVSYNYGAGNFSRVKNMIKVGVVQSTASIIVIMILLFIFATQVVVFFIGPVPGLVEETVAVMKIYLLLYAFGNVSQIATGYFMAVNKNGLAILNGLARIVIFAIPLLLILPKSLGLNGVWMAQPGADLLAFLLALVCIAREYKRLNKLEDTIKS